MNFTIADIKAITSGQIPDELKAKIAGAEKYESTVVARKAIITAVKKNAAEIVSENLAGLEIPKGVASIALLYNYNPVGGKWTVSDSPAYAMSNDVDISENLLKLIMKATVLSDAKKPDIAPRSFIKSTLGEEIIQAGLAINGFNEKVKPAIEEIYTNTEAQSLSDDAPLSTLPEGDKLSVKITYSGVKNAAGEDKAGWLEPLVSCSTKSVSKSTGEPGTRAKRTTAPDGYSSWQKWLEAGTDAEAVKILADVIVQYGQDWTKHISATNLLRSKKHPVMIDADSQNEARSN